MKPLILAALCLSAATLSGCVGGAAGTVAEVASSLGLFGTSYSILNSASSDYDAGLISACYDWHADTAKSAAKPNAGSADAVTIKTFGDAECDEVAKGHKPPAGAISTAVWLRDVEKQHAAAAEGAP